MSEKPWLKVFDEEAAKWREVWDRSYDEHIDIRPEYPEQPLKWWFNKWAAEQPDKPYIMQGDTVLTYGTVNEMARRLANALTGMGVKKNDRVAIMSPNLPQYVLAVHALLKIGAIEVPANPLYTVPELALQFKDSGTETVIVMAMFADKAIEIMKNIASPVKRVIAFSVPTIPVEVEQGENIYDFNAIIMAADNAEPEVELSMDDIVRLQYTGGTTGIPKGCVLTHRIISSQMVRISQWASDNFTVLPAGEFRALGAIPFNHVFGYCSNICCTMYCGGSLITVPVPNPDTLLDAIVQHQPTIFPTVPAMIIGLNNHPRFQESDVSCFKGVFSGSSALPEEVLNTFESITGCRIVEGYGMSESTQQITANPGRARRKIGSVGVGWPDTDVLIVDDKEGTKLVPLGEPGEIIFRGPQVMREYWDNPQETAVTLRDGWLYTGDIGRMDEDGFIFIVDRKKDIIICSGFNVFPRDIDEICYAMPEVMDACAVGIPHEKRGETVKVYLVLKEGARLTAEEVIARCREKLAPYKVPSEVEFLADLPRTLVGKPDRKAMKAMAAK